MSIEDSSSGGGAVADLDSAPSFTLMETLDASELLELSDPREVDGSLRNSFAGPDSESAETLAGPAGLETEAPLNMGPPPRDEVVPGGYDSVQIDFNSAFISSGNDSPQPSDEGAVLDESSGAKSPEAGIGDFTDNHTLGYGIETEIGASAPSSPEGEPCDEEPARDDEDDEYRKPYFGYGPRCNTDSPWQRNHWSSRDDDSGDAEDIPSSLFFPWRPTVPTGMGAGLSNLGNTCFINAILQCFTHTVPLVKALRSHNHSLPCKRDTDGFCVLEAFRDHIERSLASSGKIIAPQKLVDNLSCISSFFQRYHQEDAHEFLQCLLDRLERCCLDPNPAEGSSSSDADNIVHQTFGGRLVSKLKCCSCGHFSDKYEPLIDLSLEIEEVDNLHDALESFTKVEMIEDSDTKLTCDNCKEKVSMEKQLMLDRAPLIATLHLKRFKTDGYSVDKIGKHVEFPLELDLTPYSNHEQDGNVNLKYQLYGIVVHNGFSPTSGHYFSYIRSSPGKWHKLDDTRVIECREEFVLSQSAYILLYAKDSTPWFSSLMESQKLDEDTVTSSRSPKSVLQTVDGDDNTTGNADAVTEPDSCSPLKSVQEQFEIHICRDDGDGEEGPSFCDDEILVVKPLAGGGGGDDNLHDTTEISKHVSHTREPLHITFNKEKSCPQLFPATSSEQKTCYKTGRKDDDPLPKTPVTRSGPFESRNGVGKEQQQLKVGMTGTGEQRASSRKGGKDPRTTEALRYMRKTMPSSRHKQLQSLIENQYENEGLRPSGCKRSRSPEPCRRVVRRTQLTR